MSAGRDWRLVTPKIGILAIQGDYEAHAKALERECADFIGRKLWQFFAVPEPSDALVASTTDAYFANDTSVRAMLRTILLSDAMYSDEAYRWRILSPAEYVTRALRTFRMRLGTLRQGASAHRRRRCTLSQGEGFRREPRRLRSYPLPLERVRPAPAGRG